MSDVAEIANRDAVRVRTLMDDLLADGYILWHWWDDPLSKDDLVCMIGFLTLVKYAEDN